METLDTVNREGRARLYPSLTNPSWLVLRRRREIFRKWLARVDGHDLDVLDVGGRIQPYRPLLEGRLRRYVAIDLRQTPLVNVVGRGEQIPLAERAIRSGNLHADAGVHSRAGSRDCGDLSRA